MPGDQGKTLLPGSLCPCWSGLLMKRRLNVRLLAWLLGVGTLLAVGVHLLHGFQVQRGAAALLQQAARAEAQGQLDQAALFLNQYLACAPDDGAALVKYAEVLEKLPASPQTRWQALAV